MGRLKYVLTGLIGGLALGGLVYAQPALFPSGNTDLVTGQGTPNKITKWTGQKTIGNGSLSDTATQQNQSVCFDDNGVLNCGSSLKWNPSTGTLSGIINTAISSLISVTGISGTTTAAKNLRGACTFATGVANCPVSFTTAESDANYYLTTSCNSNKAYWITGQLAGGFTIQESTPGTGSDICSWHLIR